MGPMPFITRRNTSTEQNPIKLRWIVIIFESSNACILLRFQVSRSPSLKTANFGMHKKDRNLMPLLAIARLMASNGSQLPPEMHQGKVIREYLISLGSSE